MKQMSRKQSVFLFFLCLFFGHLGIHRFYQKKILSGLLMLVTLGGLSLWYLLDLLQLFFVLLHPQKKPSHSPETI